MNVSKATYGLQTSQLKDLELKLGHTPDFAKQEQTQLARQALRSQQRGAEALIRAQMSHRSANKLVSYRSQTTGLTEPRGAKLTVEDESIDPYASSHNWARLDEGRDLSELQKSHK